MTGQAIIAFTPTDATRTYDGSGKLSPKSAYAKRELTVSSETGLHPGLSLILGTSLIRNTADGAPSSQYTGMGFTEIGLKALLFQGAGFSVISQGTARIPGAQGLKTAATFGSTGMEYDGRLILAKGFQIGTWNGFVSLAGGYRMRAAPSSDEWRFDATVGIRPIQNVMLLVQSFTVQSTNPARGATERASSTKLQASAVFDLSQAASLQLGVFQTVNGRLTGREKGLIAALWLRY